MEEEEEEEEAEEEKKEAEETREYEDEKREGGIRRGRGVGSRRKFNVKHWDDSWIKI